MIWLKRLTRVNDNYCLARCQFHSFILQFVTYATHLKVMTVYLPCNGERVMFLHADPLISQWKWDLFIGKLCVGVGVQSEAEVFLERNAVLEPLSVWTAFCKQPVILWSLFFSFLRISGFCGGHAHCHDRTAQSGFLKENNFIFLNALMSLSQTVKIAELLQWCAYLLKNADAVTVMENIWDTTNALMAGNLLNKAQFVGSLLLVTTVDYPHGFFSKSLFCCDDREFPFELSHI